MRNDATMLEDGRIDGLDITNYPWIHERHRIFPDVFKDQGYRSILDIAAGVGITPKRISNHYDCFILSNDITPSCLKSLRKSGLTAISFDLDNPAVSFPFPDDTFDAVISLATLEHIIAIDHHMSEIHRILSNHGHLYISVPNYSGIQFIVPFLLTGKTFHNPLSEGIDKYEFYAHVRYFTYNTLLEFVANWGFKPLRVYLPLPKSSSRFQALKERSRYRASLFRILMLILYKLLPPRWAFHPVICFQKTNGLVPHALKKPRKVIL